MEEGLRLGVPLDRALESVKEWKSGIPSIKEVTSDVASSGVSEAAVVAQNEAALRELQKMMPGLGV